MSDKIRLVVFDCDGTLVNSQYSIIYCMQAAFEEEGLTPPDEESIRRIIGLPLTQGISFLDPEIPETVIGKIQEAYSSFWQVLRKQSELDEPLYPGTVEVLEKLISRGWSLGIATGKSYRGLIATLEKHKILEMFESLQTADKSRGKPDPEMLINAMNDVGAPAENTFMVGDTTFDMEMAVNAGITAIGVEWGYHYASELKTSGAHIIIKDYLALPNVLDDIWSSS